MLICLGGCRIRLSTVSVEGKSGSLCFACLFLSLRFHGRKSVLAGQVLSVSTREGWICAVPGDFLGLALTENLCLFQERRSCVLVRSNAEAGGKPCAPQKPSFELPRKTGHLKAKRSRGSEVQADAIGGFSVGLFVARSLWNFRRKL